MRVEDKYGFSLMLFILMLMTSYNVTAKNLKQTINLGAEVGASIPTVRFPFKSEPVNIKGYRLSMQAYSSRFHWNKIDLFLDFSYANWYASRSNISSSISIVALAPVFRYEYLSSKLINLFIDLSIGPAYLSETMFTNRNLGIHYTFQDMAGLGFKFGKNKNSTFSWKCIHYSNAGISVHNSGITIPFMFTLSHTFLV